MSKGSPASILSFAFLAIFYRWVSGIILSILLVTGITIYAISYSLERNCEDVYNRNFDVGSRWVSIQLGSTETDCPQNPNKDLE